MRYFNEELSEAIYPTTLPERFFVKNEPRYFPRNVAKATRPAETQPVDAIRIEPPVEIRKEATPPAPAPAEPMQLHLTVNITNPPIANNINLPAAPANVINLPAQEPTVVNVPATVINLPEAPAPIVNVNLPAQPVNIENKVEIPAGAIVVNATVNQPAKVIRIAKTGDGSFIGDVRPSEVQPA